jgi:hypothetical protein
LSPRKADASGSTFELFLSQQKMIDYPAPSIIVAFHVSQQGYPILAAETAEELWREENITTLQNEDELTAYFLKLLSDPDSKFVRQTVQFLRLQKNTSEQKPTATSES